MILQNIFWLFAIAIVALISRKISSKGRSVIIPNLLGGIILGNLALLNIPLFEGMKDSAFLKSLSELSIAFFLFSIGFDATLGEVKRVGVRAFLIAIVGIGSTVLLGVLFGPLIIHGLTSQQYFFLALALASTSVGITAGILKDLGLLQSGTARLLLTAAIIDDIIGLVILAIISTQSQWYSEGFGEIGLVILKIGIFIFAGIGIGHVCARILPRRVYQLYPHFSAKLFVALAFFAVFFFLSKASGLSAIVGAFIGGLVLERGYFNDLTTPLHGAQVEVVIEKISSLVVPVFFVMTGLSMNIGAFSSVSTVLIACGLLLIAVAGKLMCGVVAPKDSNRWLLGVGMIPRGEVSLVFANIGLAVGTLTPALFSAVLIVVVTTTVFSPLALGSIARNTNH